MSPLQLIQRHALLAVMVAIYAGISTWLSQYHEVSIHGHKAAGMFRRFLTDVPMMVFFVLSYRLLYLTYVQRDPDRIGTLKAEIIAFVSDRNRMLGGLIATMLMTGVLVSFAQLKNLIPVLNPYSWDEYFMQLDQLLHFGQHPYSLTHAAFGWHYVVSFFTGIYNFWLFMMYFVLLGACFMRPDSLVRMQFLVAFLLTWAIGGNLVATLFSSVGPVYYARIGLDDTYAGLMNLLHNHAAAGGLTVVNTQNLLWQMYTSPVPLNAISAFPSMHVASSVLMAVFLSRVSRILGLCASVFAAGIMVGSVLLAWHYAVDGYAGAVIAIACWYVAGVLVRLVYGDRSPRLVESKA